MKKTLSLLAVFAVAGMMSAPAQAADHYISGMAGISWFQDSELGLPLNIDEAAGAEINLGYGSGLTVAGAIGCDYGSTRLEAEVGYQNADIEGISATLSDDILFMDEGTYALGLEGDATVMSLMANGFYDIDLGGVELYAMAGVGVAQVNFNITGIGAADIDEMPTASVAQMDNDIDFDAIALDVSETTLAYQVGAGLAIPISDGVMLDARYRYFATTDFTLDTDLIVGKQLGTSGPVIGAGSGIDTNVSSHSAMLGLRVSL